jgi:uncharacterized C2H2 Zn-finger protein
MHSHKLLDSLDFLTLPEKEEVLWWTEKSWEKHLNKDQAWFRYKTNQKYLQKTMQQLQTFMALGMLSTLWSYS